MPLYVTGPVVPHWGNLRIHRPPQHRRTPPAAPVRATVSGERVVYLASDTGRKIALPYAPQSVTHDGIAPTWVATARVGRKPLNQRGDDGLRTCSFDAWIGGPDWTVSIEATLALFVAMAQEGDRISIGLSALEVGLWRLTSMSVGTEERQPLTKAVTRATVSLGFTEVSDYTAGSGITSAKAPPATPAPHRKAGSGKAAKATTYRWVTGDTLPGVAQRLLGDAARMGEIARASGLRDIRSLPVGTLLTVPPR